ncbi:MAG: hypothetical protein LC733_02980, partial [Actinobacteria bacterium]|nr:hypothetical protein [Actinomycetota bacterium]
SLGRQPAVPGHDVQLTIDLDIQRVAEESLQQALETARKTYDPGQAKSFIAPAGSAVVLDPRDGAILAMASFPTYQPSEFVNGIRTDAFQKLQDPAPVGLRVDQPHAVGLSLHAQLGPDQHLEVPQAG